MRDVRLPKTWIPESYNVTLLPKFSPRPDWSYPGKVQITLRASNDTTEEGNARIFLHTRKSHVYEDTVMVQDDMGNVKDIEGIHMTLCNYDPMD